MADVHKTELTARASPRSEGDMASFFFSNDESAHIDTHAHKRAVLTPVKHGEADAVSAPGALDATPRRHEVAPPSRFARSAPVGVVWVQRFWRWLWDMDESPRELAPVSSLRGIQSEFIASLWDLQSLRANHVRDQIGAARSLRELWHLRADVFKVISVHRGQMEAQLRLDALDSHFPVRASRRSDDGRGKVTTW
jgi:hypothetical protein